MLLSFPRWVSKSLLPILTNFVYVIKHPGWRSTSASRAGGRLAGAPRHHPEGVQLQALLPSLPGDGRQEPVPFLLCHPSFHPFAPLAEKKKVRSTSKELASYRDGHALRLTWNLLCILYKRSVEELQQERLRELQLQTSCLPRLRDPSRFNPGSRISLSEAAPPRSCSAGGTPASKFLWIEPIPLVLAISKHNS